MVGSIDAIVDTCTHKARSTLQRSRPSSGMVCTNYIMPRASTHSSSKVIRFQKKWAKWGQNLRPSSSPSRIVRMAFRPCSRDRPQSGSVKKARPLRHPRITLHPRLPRNVRLSLLRHHRGSARHPRNLHKFQKRVKSLHSFVNRNLV